MTGQSSKASSSAGGPDQRWQVAGLCLVLAAITFAVFGQTLRHGFIDYDDSIYIYDNPMVLRGLTFKGIIWAFTFGEIGHWHPLTWLTHMADCQIYGLWAGGHHLTNVALHAAAAVLLFLALKEMTGSLWRSAFVAAVFAIHPLRVESVAWIAERKDVLSGVFFMLTLWAYARYARRPSRGRYAAVALAFAFGLLCKNMLVTLPLVLLLLDWWPLRRLRPDVVKEKIPLFLLAIGSCAATFLVPEKLLDTSHVPFLERVGNAVVSYGIYLWQTVFPSGLANPYVYAPNGQPFWKIAVALAVLAAISTSVLARRKKHPYLLVGWLWYLGMLVPTLGIIQMSSSPHADRYTYLPGIGLALAGTWAVADLSAGWKHQRAVLGGLMAAVIGALMVCAWIQTGYWKNDETFWIHTLACTTDNYVAHQGLGNVLLKKGRVGEAITEFQTALQIKPDYEKAHSNLGLALMNKGNLDDAIIQYQMALQIRPDSPEAHCNLGTAFLQKGKMDEAITCYQQALQIRPDYLEVLNNLAWVLAEAPQDSLRNGHKAVELAQRANQLTRNANPVVLGTLAAAYAESGRFSEAVETAQRAVRMAGMQSNTVLASQLQSQIQLYQTGTPFHLPAQTH